MKKRTCGRCKALGLSHNLTDIVCCLLYDIEVDEYGANPKPKDECPKPLTRKAWAEAAKNKKEDL